MIEKITKELKRIEKEREIKILYAVESGSRAWGFASKDSDWDARFIYIQNPDWYLSIDSKKDSMELMLPEDLDFAGWELRKTLKLFRKSNPALLEWLRSPLIYIEKYSTTQKMRELSKYYFNPKSCTYHYLHMAKGNYRDYLQTDIVRIKKYFYILRPILACRWIETKGTMPPMEFEDLVKTQVESPQLKKEIEKLLERKRLGDELDREPKIAIINQFVEEQLAHFEKKVKDYNVNLKPETTSLDELFRDALNEVWKFRE